MSDFYITTGGLVYPYNSKLDGIRRNIIEIIGEKRAEPFIRWVCSAMPQEYLSE